MTFRIGLVLAMIIFVCPSCMADRKAGTDSNDKKEKIHMQTGRSDSAMDEVVAKLRFPDQAYFEFDEEAEDDLDDSILFMSDFLGTAIGAPVSVDVQERQRLPLLWIRKASVLRSWQVEEMRNSMIIISDLATGRISSHYAFKGPKRIDLSKIPYSASGEAPAGDVAEGGAVSCELIDVRSLADLPWHPRQLAITVIIYDWISNTSIVTLTRQGQGLTPEEEKALSFSRKDAIRIDEQYKNPDEISEPGIHMVPSAQTQKLSESGVALLVPQKVDRAESRWDIQGAAKIRLQPGAIVEQVPGGPSRTDSSPASPDAVISLMLLLVQLDEPLPQQVPIQIPIHFQKALKIGDEIEVAFSLNLKPILSQTKQLGTIQAYLIGGEYISGPHPFNVTE